jgi:transketolase
MANEKRNSKKVLGASLLRAAETYPNLVLVSADSGPNSGFGDFIKQYPGRFYEFGIMEQGVMGVASGMATTGLMPVFCAPAPFVTGRPYEMFRIDVGYMHQNVKVIGRNAGFSYSDLGPTHYGLDDIALVRMIPDVVILAPQFADELEAAFDAMLRYKGPVYMRVHNSALPEREEKTPFEIGRGSVLADGEGLAIITTGNLTQNVLEALPILAARGIHPLVIGMPTIRPLDEELVRRAAKTGRILTVEEHFRDGGLGTIVSDFCAANCPVPVKKLGVPNLYATSGDYGEMAHLYGLDAEGIAAAAEFPG